MSFPVSKKQIDPLQRYLFGPGPSNVSPSVMKALASPVLSHLDRDFLALVDESRQMLRETFRTRNPWTFAMSGTGTSGMEACLVNLLEPGDMITVCAAGYFGLRMAEIAKRVGAQVACLEQPWGQTFDVNLIRESLKSAKPKLLAIVHAETSTGALQDLREIGALCSELDVLFLVDCVTSLGGIPLEIDAWQIDAAYSCSQKCLGAPSGLSPVTISERAQSVIQKRKTPVVSFYLDFALMAKYLDERVYHHTTSSTMHYALHQCLREVTDEGIENRWARHRLHYEALRDGLLSMGFSYVPNEAKRLPNLNAVYLPAGLEEAKLRERLFVDHNIEVGAGLGIFKNKILRIGLMGQNAEMSSVLFLLGALEDALNKLGVAPGRESAPAIANKHYSAAEEVASQNAAADASTTTLIH